MASIPLRGVAAPFNPPLATAAIAALDLHSRDQVEELIEQLIATLDAVDGDCEVEDGDEDCCDAYDDRPEALPLGCNDPLHGWGAGDPDDAEENAPAEGRLAHRKRRVVT